MGARADATPDGTAAAARRHGALARLLRRNRWLIARRVVQFGVLAAFASGPWFGVPVAEGTLAASRWFGALTLVDPFAALQSLFAGHALAPAAIVGALAVAAFYALTAGRLFCAWVCPVNLVADAAAGLRRALGWRGAALLHADRRLRHGVLAAVLLASAASGTVWWETINPINWTLRGIVFGASAGAAAAVAAVFVFDLVALRNGWCGHLCPVGAFQRWLGRFGRVAVRADNAAACTHCGECHVVCPEPQVIPPVLRAGAATRTIADVDCLRCGRCVDRCDEGVFVIGIARATAPDRRRT